MTATSTSSRSHYANIDIAKFILAFFVVAIHVRPFDNIASSALDSWFYAATAIAVPFFFMASGFLCFARNTENPWKDGGRRALHQAKAVLELYLVWTVIFLPLIVWGSLMDGMSKREALAHFVQCTIFVGGNIWAWPLWYLLALAVALTITGLFAHWTMRPRGLIVFSVSMLLLGIALDTVHGAESAPTALAALSDSYFGIFITTRNGLFEGLFYVMCGALIGLNRDKAAALNLPAIAAFAIMGYAGSALISNSAQGPFCAILSICIFLLSMRKTGERPQRWMRNASTVVYLVHMIFFILVIYFACGHEGGYVYGDDYNHLAVYAAVCALSLGTAAAAIKLSEKHPIVKRIFHC